MSKLSRRDLLRLGLGTGALASGLGAYLTRRVANAKQLDAPEIDSIGKSSQSLPVVKSQDHRETRREKPGVLPSRLLGQTGQRVSIFGLGGASAQTPLSNGPHELAVAIVERALALGVTYFDTAPSYGDGRSETAIGVVAKRQRARMTIASKTAERTYDGAMRELEMSLQRLQTDHLDVWLMHHVSLPHDTETAFGARGAIKALERARAEKIVRFAGVSGHHRTDVLSDWLRRFRFDVALTVVNAVDKHHPDSFIERVLPLAQERRVGVVAMKIPAYGKLLRLDQGVGMKQALAYALSQRGVASGIIACDSIPMLEQNVAAARAFAALDAKAQAALEAKTASYWREASFYRDWL